MPSSIIRTIVTTSLVVFSACALVSALPGSSRAQTCEASSLPSCGGFCPLGSECAVGGDPVEPGGQFCFCKAVTADVPSCGCDLAAPAGDATRAIMTAIGGESSAFLTNGLIGDSDPKTLAKVGRSFRKLGITAYKANSFLLEAAGTPAKADKLEQKSAKLIGKAVLMVGKLEDRIDNAETAPTALIGSATAGVLRSSLNLLGVDLGFCCRTPLPKCFDTTGPSCGGVCDSNKVCKEVPFDPDGPFLPGACWCQ